MLVSFCETTNAVAAVAAAGTSNIVTRALAHAAKAAEGFRRTSSLLKAVVDAACPEPARSTILALVGVLNLVADCVVQLEENREVAVRLGLTCEAAADSLRKLLAGSSSSPVADELAATPAVRLLGDALDAAHVYLLENVAPSFDTSAAPHKRWIAAAKATARERDVRDNLEKLRVDIQAASLQAVFAVSADLPANLRASLDSRFATLSADITTNLRTELRLIVTCSSQAHDTVLRDADRAAHFGDFADRKMDAVEDLLLDARNRVRLIKEEIACNNLNVMGDAKIATSVRAEAADILQDLTKEVEGFAKLLKRKSFIRDWMLPANAVSFSQDNNSKVNEGGFAKVYFGTMNGKQVAVKVFKVVGFSSGDVERTIAREISAWRSVSGDHDCILRLLGVSTKLSVYIVSELCENGNARGHLHRLREFNEATWNYNLRRVLSDAAKGLQFMHSKGIIHRDVKGRNIFVRADGSAVVGDFGLSRLMTASLSSQTSVAAPGADRIAVGAGTLAWSSPEQILGKSHLTPWTDTWSFGIMVLELLADRDPFADLLDPTRAILDDPPRLPTDVDATGSSVAALVELAIDCCRRVPEERLADNKIVELLKMGALTLCDVITGVEVAHQGIKDHKVQETPDPVNPRTTQPLYSFNSLGAAELTNLIFSSGVKESIDSTFKVGAKKTAAELAQLDANEGATDPRNVVVQSIAMETAGRSDVVIGLSTPAAIEALKDQVMTIKEGCEYRLKFQFIVNHDVVSGLKYMHVVKRKGIKVDKLEEMLGSYGPSTEIYEKKLPIEEPPSGMLARGHYTVRSRFVDDDGHVHLEWTWSFDIKKEWD
ncbi:hypothetical protein HK405_010552 [Cladochytrium tenue]|nr:hypothetical protein HK405_010552 [Cladochytrium tenue]